MNRFGVRFPRWNSPAHLSRTSTSSRLRSSHAAPPPRSSADSSCASRHAVLPHFSTLIFSNLLALGSEARARASGGR